LRRRREGRRWAGVEGWPRPADWRLEFLCFLGGGVARTGRTTAEMEFFCSLSVLTWLHDGEQG
jgi:hypothetical protein